MLVADALADDERMADAPWSFQSDGRDVVVLDCDHMSVASLEYADEDAAGIAGMRNRNRAIADQLRAANERVDSLHSALSSALRLTYTPECSRDERWYEERERLNQVLGGEGG